jgi:hypothetical protein
MENSWLFPALEVIHVVGLALLVGTIALGDASVLGWLALREPLAAHTRAGLWLTLATGALLFAANLERYSRNPAFLAKMILLGGALWVHYRWRPRQTRASAACSLAMWSLVTIAARAVIDFDV